MIITITKKQLWISLIIILVLISAWVATRPVVAPSPVRQSVQQTNTPQPQQTSDGIDVDVRRLPDATGDQTVFEIALNTHSGDLSTFDAQKNVEFRTVTATILSPIAVGGDRETHHRTILVTFTGSKKPGTLVIKNLGSIPERTFIIQ